jgi:hypothetical protein
MSYFRSINQQVTVSTTNSDTSNLAVGQTYTGTAASTLGVNAIQVNLKADQNCTLYVDQGPDTTSWPLTDSFNYYNNSGGNSWTTQTTDAYFRTRVTNTGTASTTTKYLSSILCPIVEAIPRALSDEGNLKVGVYELESRCFNVPTLATAMRELKTTSSFRLVGVQMIGSTVDTNFWQTSTTGSGTVTQTGGEMYLSDGTTASSTARVQSVRRARWVPVTQNYYRGLVTVPVQSGACIRRWGAFDTTDGYFFQYDGTNLNFITRKSSVDTTYVNGTFNGNYGSSWSLPASTNTTYEIYWSNKNTFFIINDILLHRVDSTTTTLVSTPSLLVGAECNNGSGNIANNQLIIRTQTIHRLGHAETAPIYSNATTNSASAVTLKYGPGRLHSVILNYPGSTSNTITLYDSTGIANSFAIVATGGTTTTLGSYNYNLDFYNGLSYVLNGGTSAANVTVIYE